MEIKAKYCCPHCDRTIFSRRIPTCEFCGKALPAHLLYSKKDLAEIDDYRKSLEEKRMRDSAKARRESVDYMNDYLGEATNHSFGSFGSDDGSSD